MYNRVALALLLILVVTFSVTSAVLQDRSSATVEAPMLEVDPFWPKPLPNNWVLGWTVGVFADAQDRIWVVHRPKTLEAAERYGADKVSECCFAAPPVLAFDQAGNLLKSWGGPGPGYDWPDGEHGISVDHKGNVWIAAQNAPDSHVVKFTQDGKFLLQIGKPKMAKGSHDTENVNRATKVWVDSATNEAFVSDGYGNRRVVVFDADTGKYKRHWGAYGNRPDDADPYNAGFASVGKDYDPNKPAQQFGRAVHGIAISKDGLVYVNDRTNNRVQVFRKNGTFVKEAFIARNTRGDGSSFDTAFSADPAQRFLYVADGSNHKVHVLVRDTMEEVTTFGSGGRQPGMFYAVHNVASDSKGNVYTAETRRGQRVQRFIFKGIGRVPRDQKVLWPKSNL